MKKALAFFLGFALLLSACSCEGIPSPVESETESTVSDVPTDSFSYSYCEYINDDTSVVPLTAPDECLYYRELIKANGLETVYDAICYTASHLSDRVAEAENASAVYFDRAVTEDELAEVYRAVLADHPELWHLNVPSFAGCTADEESPSVAYLTYGVNCDEVAALNGDILAAADELLAKTHPLHRQDDILSFLCAYFAETCDFEGGHAGGKIHIAMSDIFLHKPADCFSVSQALNFLLRRLGFVALLGFGGTEPYLYTHCWTITVSNGDYVYTDMQSIGYTYLKEMLRFNWEKFEYRNYTSDTVLIAPGVPLSGSAVGMGRAKKTWEEALE